MKITFWFLLLLCPVAADAQGTICTITGPQADSLILALPRDSAAWEKIGILFTNRIFLNHAKNPKKDADSAIWYLEQAVSISPKPETQIYLRIARALRAREDSFLQKAFGKTRQKVLVAFAECDTFALVHPENKVVQFLSANLFAEANKLPNKEYYWQRSRKIFEKLLNLAEAGKKQNSAETDFFTPEILGNIRLNQAKLSLKLSPDSQTALILAKLEWEKILDDYPGTLAAANAQKQLQKHK
ncbi:hypothetical protein C4546_00250 [Candidatus Parcubacteria bacterium]|jgi:hypothetical protein|nr:MAG: hypothetical protein C4546_00250 [Candidatus Parcubacteria bacterium]